MPDATDGPDRAPRSATGRRATGSDALLVATARSLGGKLSFAAALACVHQAGEALVPVLVGVVVDRAVDGGSLHALLLWLGVLALDFLGLSLSFRFGSRSAILSSERAAHDLRVRAAGRLLAADGARTPGIRGRTPGELLSVATSDAQRVGQFNASLVVTAGAVVALVLAAVLLLRMSLPLGLLIVVGTPAVLVGMNRLGRPLERKGAEEQAAAARAAGTAVDFVAGLRVLKGLRAERPAYARYAQANSTSLRATLVAARSEALLDGTALLLAGVLVAAVALVAGRLALTGDISLGDLIACVGLCQFLIGPTQVLMSFGPALARARASAGRIAVLLPEDGGGAAALADAATGRGRDHETHKTHGDRAGDGGGGPSLPSDTPGALSLRALHAGRLRGVSLDVGPGEHLGIVVPDPATAAELVGCLNGEGAAESGTVILDGTPLDALPLESARAALLVAPHHPYLFDGSVADNLRIRDGGEHDTAGDAADQRALAAAAADEVVAALPDGIRTRIGEQGAFLSGGQRQRVALARALRADPPVLVLHEPTTAVDSVTEARIADGVRALRPGRTTVLITSSPNLLASCDRVVLLDGGTVAAVASHAGLAATHPGYRAAVFA
ncbi:ABC transporter transmembrane domain-containing protein [Streptomyces sp. 8L]|uniref:ABC transporter transmembrane domain-containing protein n=1 Tax=Streptomyces sp. 8L TaxID=2877242 RepID=UPI001CD809D7|nr:ABC transporter ATP-binding protein [Streptomyces sp. 8L]MCA1218967.1 ABC transporter ATP-binding protein/permease [Streptomyces sp. 8L]